MRPAYCCIAAALVAGTAQAGDPSPGAAPAATGLERRVVLAPRGTAGGPAGAVQRVEFALHRTEGGPLRFELVDWSGRAILDDKAGHIPEHLDNILTRIGIRPEHWLDAVKKMEKDFHRAVGPVDKIKRYCSTLRQKWLNGTKAGLRLFHCSSG